MSFLSRAARPAAAWLALVAAQAATQLTPQALAHSASYLHDLQQKFGNLGLAAAAYNAGPGRVSAYPSGLGSVDHDWWVEKGSISSAVDRADPRGRQGLLSSPRCERYALTRPPVRRKPPGDDEDNQTTRTTNRTIPARSPRRGKPA